MSLKSMTVKQLNELSDEAIFERAEAYYLQRRVEDLEYEQINETITATVVGNESLYDVTLRLRNDSLSGFCTCPYDGYPCKHFVSVGLEFIHNQSQYIQAIESKQLKFKQLEKKLLEMPQENVVEKLMEKAVYDTDFYDQLDLIVSWGPTALIAAYEKKLKRHFRNKAPSPLFLLESLKKLRTLYAEILLFSDAVQVKLSWSIMSHILSFLNKHNMDEEILDDLFYQIWEDTLLPLLAKDPFQKEQIIGEMKEYERKANCSLADNITDCYSDLEED